MMDYSAGFTSEGWFQKEISIVLSLKIEGLNRKEILEKILAENSFQLGSASSIKKRFQMAYRRAEAFSTELASLFINASRLDQKALLLYSYLKCYRLPYEFFNEVILFNYRNNKCFIQSIDIDFFIERKSGESDKVAGWRPETIKRLRSSILMFFRESGLLSENHKSKTYEIIPLHMSTELKTYAKNDQLLHLLNELR